MKFRKPISRKKIVISALALLLIAGGLSGAYYIKRRNNLNSAANDRTSTINYEEATTTEREEAEANKDRIVEESREATPSPGTNDQKKTVTPTITQASSSSINAYVSGIFEEGGTCTAKFTKETSTLTKTSVGFQNVSYTQCAPISIESGFLSAGTWSVTVYYESVTAQGTSSAQTIGVQ